MNYNDVVESLATSLLEEGLFWSNVKQQLAVGLSLDPNHIGLENTVGKGWDIVHNPKKGSGGFPNKIGSGKSLQQAFSDALGYASKHKEKRAGDPSFTQGKLF